MAALKLSLWVATLSACLVLPGALACSWLLTRCKLPGLSLVQAAISLPLVLPPVATGYFLLVLFSPKGLCGKLLHQMGIDIILTWKAAVLAAGVVSFPLAVQTIKVALQDIDPRLEQAARTLGASPWRTFLTVTLPLSYRGLLAAWILAFSRSLGEFGATILVAGNIPGYTQTLPTAIFSAIEGGNDQEALRLVGIACIIGFTSLVAVEHIFNLARRERDK